jgi:cytochrome c-type biogenesis protein CcmH/NrfF
LLRRLLAATLAVALLMVASFALVPQARAQGAGHGQKGFIVLDQLETAERQRARSLFSEIVCKCPNENWSKSLMNCPDGCADQQKQEILQQIQLDWDDARIIDYQIKAYGPRAHGKPDDVLTYLLPVLFLLGCIGVVVVVFMRWRRSAAEAHEARSQDAPPADDELAAIERELKELR